MLRMLVVDDHEPFGRIARMLFDATAAGFLTKAELSAPALHRLVGG